MNDLSTFSTWLLNSCTLVGHVVFTQWQWFGSAIFGIIVIRKLVDIFKNTF